MFSHLWPLHLYLVYSFYQIRLKFGTVKAVKSDPTTTPRWCNYKISPPVKSLSLTHAACDLFGHMLELAVGASLKVTPEEEMASLFSPSAVSAQRSATEEAQHLWAEKNQGSPLWECLSVEQAFLHISCLLFVCYGLVRKVQMARSAASVFP